MDQSAFTQANNLPVETNDPLNKLVKAKFQLFKGLRTQEEDQQIYDSVMDLCFDEILAFMGLNLQEADRDSFLREFDMEKSEAEREEILQRYLSKIPNSSQLLSVRMNEFLNDLNYQSLKGTIN